MGGNDCVHEAQEWTSAAVNSNTLWWTASVSMLPTSHSSGLQWHHCWPPQLPLSVKSAELTVCQSFQVHRETATVKEASKTTGVRIRVNEIMSCCTEECEAGMTERGFVSGQRYSLPACAVDAVFVRFRTWFFCGSTHGEMCRRCLCNVQKAVHKIALVRQNAFFKEH